MIRQRLFPSFSIPIRTRILGALAIICLILTLTTSAVIMSVNNSVTTLRQIQELSKQQQEIHALYQSWTDVADSTARVVLLQEKDGIEKRIKPALTEFNRQMNGLNRSRLGQSPAWIKSNTTITQNMQQSLDALNAWAGRLDAAATDGYWETVRMMRYSELPSIEYSLTQGLDQLSENLDTELKSLIAAKERAYSNLRLQWGATGLILMVMIAMLARTNLNILVGPINQLIQQVLKAYEGDYHAIRPLNRRDEIGRLSETLTLLTTRLREAQETLEQRIEERTQDLNRRTTQVQAAAEISRDISSTLEMENLLSRSVNLIRDRFGFYHAGIFLIDEAGEFAVLRAATGEAGQEMLEKGHKLRVGETGLVGYTTGSGKARIALDTDADIVHFKNPLLPNTRSEMALPLKAGDRVIGALNVQSTRAEAFDENDITILQVMADQLAVAIDNARLLGQLQDNLHEMENLYREYGRQNWEHLMKGRAIIGYEYGQNGAKPLKPGEEYDDLRSQPMRVPLEVRGTEIGVVEVWTRTGRPSPNDQELLQAISSRLSQAMESARLFEETQARATREQMINQMTTNISRSLDIDMLLKAAVQELGQMPQVSEVSVHITPQEGSLLEELGKREPSGNGHKNQNDATSPAPNGHQP